MAIVMEDIQALEARHVLQTYRRQPVTLRARRGRASVRRRGPRVSRPAVGHRRRLARPRAPGLRARIAEQAQTLLHTSNLFFHPLQGQLAERLAHLSGLPRAFFCNSGTEAVEACLKFARRYWHTLGETRTEIIALEDSFHGRTIGALSVTSDEHYRAPFAPLLPGITFVPNDKPEVIAAGDYAQHRGHHRRADPGRRRRAAADAGVCGGDQRSVPANRHPAHRRRSAERPRPHRLPVLFGRDRAEAAAHVARQGARRRRAGRRGAPQRGCRPEDFVRRSRQHVRRQSAGVPGGSVLPRRTRRRRPARAYRQGGTALRAADSCAGAPDTRSSRKCAALGLMWGLDLTIDAAPVVPGRARPRRHRQPHGRDGRPAAAAADDHRSRSRRSARRDSTRR